MNFIVFVDTRALIKRTYVDICSKKKKRKRRKNKRNHRIYINKKKEKKKIVGGTAEFLTSTRFTAGTQYRWEYNKYLSENTFIHGEQIKLSIKPRRYVGEFAVPSQCVPGKISFLCGARNRALRKANLYMTSLKCTIVQGHPSILGSPIPDFRVQMWERFRRCARNNSVESVQTRSMECRQWRSKRGNRESGRMWTQIASKEIKHGRCA